MQHPFCMWNWGTFSACQKLYLKGNSLDLEANTIPFLDSFINHLQELPVNDEYAPPINILVFDNNTVFGKSLVGLHEIHSLKKFEVHPDQSQSASDSLSQGEERSN